MSRINTETKAFVCDKSDKRLLLPCYLLGLAALLLFVPFKLGVNVPVFLICVYAVVFIYQGWTGVPSDRGSTSLFLIVLISSLPFILYDGSALRVIHFALLMASVVFQIYAMFSRRKYPRLSEYWLVDAVNAVALTPLGNLGAFWRALTDGVKSGKSWQYIHTALGVVLAMPVVILISSQLTAADAAFEHIKNVLFPPGLRIVYLGLAGLLAGLPLGMIGYGILYGCRNGRRTNLLKKPTYGRFNIIPSRVIAALLIPIIATYLVYLGSQTAYLFSAFSGFLPADYSYSEYARRGFMELCSVSLINLTIIGAALLLVRKSGDKEGRFMGGLTVILCACSLIFIVIALSKMGLYMARFGLTVNRIYTSAFMLGLALVFICLILRCFLPKFKIIRAVTVGAIVLFIALCFIDADYIAASYNRDAYFRGAIEGFDVDMLYRSSDSVVPVVIDVYKNADGDLKEQAGNFLDDYSRRHDDSIAALRSFNIAGYNAWEAYKDFAAMISGGGK